MCQYNRQRIDGDNLPEHTHYPCIFSCRLACNFTAPSPPLCFSPGVLGDLPKKIFIPVLLGLPRSRADNKLISSIDC